MLTGPASLLSILNAVYHLVGGTSRQEGPGQSVSTMNTHRNPCLNTRTTSSNNQEREEIPTRLEEVNLEDISIHFLCTCSTDPNWKQIVSTCNDYGQTLAHIAVTLGYFQLLYHLFRWRIDLNAVDSMGFSALHYAYLFKQEECAKMLIQSGVNRFIVDDLGRSPADLDPSLKVRLRSAMDMDGDSRAAGAPPIKCDTEMRDDAGKRYATHLLIQQWMRESDDARSDDVPLSRRHSQETGSPPALDSADERVRVVMHDLSFLLGIHTPEEHSTPVKAEEIDLKVEEIDLKAEEIDLKALIETGTPLTFPTLGGLTFPNHSRKRSLSDDPAVSNVIKKQKTDPLPESSEGLFYHESGPKLQIRQRSDWLGMSSNGDQKRKRGKGKNKAKRKGKGEGERKGKEGSNDQLKEIIEATLPHLPYLDEVDRAFLDGALKTLRSAPFLRSPQQIEPTVRKDGACDLDVIRSPRSTGIGQVQEGDSVYFVFLSQIEDKFLCWICGHKMQVEKQLRALCHVRLHFKHRPFHCNWRIVSEKGEEIPCGW